VQAPVAEEFVRRLAERMESLVIGPGLDTGAQVGPLIDEAARQKVASLVSDAVERGAVIRTGGGAVEGPGYFYPPTVLSGVPAEARMRREEIFGPVAPVTTFDTEEQVLGWANDTEHGLVSYLYTTDLDRGLRVSEALETGMVGLNRGVVSNPAAPFGGVKQSGLGREGGREGLLPYLETKTVLLDEPPT
jgi:succinate-semialdehyde dehydrogenase/glutarate-semialdehyde dehydrogenase